MKFDSIHDYYFWTWVEEWPSSRMSTMKARIRNMFQGDMRDDDFNELCADSVCGFAIIAVILCMLAAMNYFGALS